MSFSPLTERTPNCANVHRSSWSRSTLSPSSSSSGNMFNGLKKKLSRRSSNPRDISTTSTTSKMAGSRTSGLAPPPQSSNPFSSSSPSTRRPIRPGMNAFSTTPNEPPPAYTPRQASQNTNNTTAINSADDDQYYFLKTFDTIFLIDDSGSMAGRSWRETGAALETITPICTAHDADGIDIYFLNHPDSTLYHNITSAGTVVEIFQSVRPGGGTPTGQRLDNLLRPYLARVERDPLNTKPINIIVITDGEPSDDVESVIIDAANRLDNANAKAWQVGIQFFQVGKEPGAREHLKQLDDDITKLAGKKLRDIVDTVPYTNDEGAELSGEGIMKVLLGSVNRRWDRKSFETHRT